MLVVIETHPVQYRAPVYRALREKCGVPLTVVYGSDFSIAGYHDAQFGTRFAWDTDLLAGYDSYFLSKVAEGGGDNLEKVSIKGLDHALDRLRPSAVLLVGYSPRFHQLAFFECWRRMLPLLFRGETTDRKQPTGALKRWLRARMLRSLYHRCSAFLYVGQNSRRHFESFGCPESRLFFSPYCVDTAHFQCEEADRPALRREKRGELGIDDSKIVLLFSGKLYKAKGPALLLEGIKALDAPWRERLELLVVGDGEMKTDLEKFARETPAVRAHFAGFQNQTRLSGFYHAADVLALSSYSETWGLVVNEALHHGVPCIVSDAVGCAPDLIEPGVTGEIFANGSAESLSAAIRRAIELTGRPEIRGKCRQKVAGYSVEKAAEGIARAYRAAAKSKTVT